MTSHPSHPPPRSAPAFSNFKTMLTIFIPSVNVRDTYCIVRLYCVCVEAASRSSGRSTRRCARHRRCCDTAAGRMRRRPLTRSIRRCRSPVCPSPTSVPRASCPTCFSARSSTPCRAKPCWYVSPAGTQPLLGRIAVARVLY